MTHILNSHTILFVFKTTTIFVITVFSLSSYKTCTVNSLSISERLHLASGYQLLLQIQRLYFFVFFFKGFLTGKKGFEMG